MLDSSVGLQPNRAHQLPILKPAPHPKTSEWLLWFLKSCVAMLFAGVTNHRLKKTIREFFGVDFIFFILSCVKLSFYYTTNYFS